MLPLEHCLGAWNPGPETQCPELQSAGSKQSDPLAPVPQMALSYGSFLMAKISRATTAAVLVGLLSCTTACFNHYGQLPPEVIQKIVREHYAVFQKCYEDGLRHNPNLKGRV